MGQLDKQHFYFNPLYIYYKTFFIIFYNKFLFFFVSTLNESIKLEKKLYLIWLPFQTSTRHQITQLRSIYKYINHIYDYRMT